jgi:hypothetical protein
MSQFPTTLFNIALQIYNNWKLHANPERCTCASKVTTTLKVALYVLVYHYTPGFVIDFGNWEK